MLREEKSGTRREPWTPLLCSYPDSVKINRLSFEAETLYTRLLAQVDDRSNYDGDPVLIAAGLFRRRLKAGQVDVEKVERWRDELTEVGLARLYEADSETYLHLVGVKKMLRTGRKRDHRFPEHPSNGAPSGSQVAAKWQPSGSQMASNQNTSRKPNGNRTGGSNNLELDAIGVGVGVGVGEGVVVVTPPVDDDDGDAGPSLNRHFAENTQKLIDTWNEFAPRKVSPAEMMAVDREYVPLITGVPPNRFSPEELLDSVKNYRAALAIPNSQAGKHTLAGFLQRGTFRKFIPGVYNPDHFDGSRFNRKGNERDLKSEMEAYYASKSGD